MHIITYYSILWHLIVLYLVVCRNLQADVVTRNALISVLEGRWQEALRPFSELSQASLQPTTVTFNSLLKVSARLGQRWSREHRIVQCMLKLLINSLRRTQTDRHAFKSRICVAFVAVCQSLRNIVAHVVHEPIRRESLGQDTHVRCSTSSVEFPAMPALGMGRFPNPCKLRQNPEQKVRRNVCRCHSQRIGCHVSCQRQDQCGMAASSPAVA